MISGLVLKKGKDTGLDRAQKLITEVHLSKKVYSERACPAEHFGGEIKVSPGRPRTQQH